MTNSEAGMDSSLQECCEDIRPWTGVEHLFELMTRKTSKQLLERH